MLLPIIWTFLATGLLVYGIHELWNAPRRRVALALQRAEAVREGSLVPEGTGFFSALLHTVLAKLKPYLATSDAEDLRKRLLWAGQPFGLTAESYQFAKLTFMLTAALLLPSVVALSADGGRVFGALLAGVAAGYLLPDKYLQHLIKQRNRQIRAQLPHFVHLLATTLEAGLPIVEAVRRVASEASGLLAAEMLRTVHEMAAGKPAALAWQHLQARTNCQELHDVLQGIIQAQEMGVAVADQLRFQVRTLRTRKQQQANENAQAAAVKMKIPIILFIVLPTMVVLLGPAIFNVLSMLAGE